MKCVNCGNGLNDSARFCPVCGQKVEASGQNTLQKQNMTNGQPDFMAQRKGSEKPKKKNTMSIVLASMLGGVLLCTAFAWFVWPGSEKMGWIKETGADYRKEQAVLGKADEEDGSGESVSVSQEIPSKVSDAVSREALDQMLALLDETFLYISDNIADGDIEEMSKQLDRYYERFEALEGVDENLYAAGKEIYDILSGDFRNSIEFEHFREDAGEYLQQYSDMIGIFSSGGTPVEIYNSGKEALEKLQQTGEKVNCPAYLAPAWDKVFVSTAQYKEVFFQYAYGIQQDDLIRTRSAFTILNHIAAHIDENMDEMFHLMEEENKVTHSHSEIVYAIYDEIVKASEMDAEKRASYQFANMVGGKINLSYDVIDTIYPTLFNSYDQFLIIEADCAIGERDLVVECEIPGLTQVFKQSYHIGTGLTPIYIKPPASPTPTNLKVARDSQIRLTITEKDGTLIDAQSFPVHIATKYDMKWYSDEFGVATKDNILCYLAPESAKITELKRKAIDELSEFSGGKIKSFAPAYPTQGYSTDVWYYLHAAAIMRAMSDMGVCYMSDAFSIDNAGQHIKLPEDVLEEKSGLCIETSLVVASAMQSAGVHTYIVLTTGHAQVAIENGENGDYFLIETTMLPNDWSNFYSGGKWMWNSYPVKYMTDDEWMAYLDEKEGYLVDCSMGNLLGLTPFAD